MEAFIRSVTDQIRCVRARDGVARELADHIEDQAAAYEESGDAHEEAVRKAVREMGDPVEVGVEMDRIHRPQVDRRLIAMAFAFSIAGFFIIFGIDSFAQHPDYMLRRSASLLLSFVVMAGMYFLDYSFIGRYAYGICVVMTVVMLIYRVGLATPVGRDPFMPVYLYIPVYAAMLYRLRGKGYRAAVWGIGLLAGIMFSAYMMAVTLPVLVNIYLICTILLLIAVWKGWFAVDRKIAAAGIIGVLVLLPAAYIIMRVVSGGAADSFRMARLQAWLHPERYAEGAGYYYLWLRQEWRSVRLIGAAQDSVYMNTDLSWPPDADGCCLLRIICRYGILAGLAVILALIAVIVRAFHIVRQQKNQLGFMTAAACFMIFLVNCLEGILISTGYWPMTGSIQLPFLSYGIYPAIAYAALIGLLLSLYRNERIITDETVTRRPAWRLSIRLEKR